MSLSGTISSDAKFAPDEIWSAEALPNATSKLSDVFMFGEIQDALEVVVLANTNISIADTERLAIELHGSATRTGTFAKEAVLYDETADGDAIEFTAGDVIGILASNRGLSPFNKLNVICTGNESSEKIDAYIRSAMR